MQLPPIMGRVVFTEPSNKEFLITHKISPRWRMFQSILLEKNHRQGSDKMYADLLNRIRIKAYTKEDLQTLAKRIRPLSHNDVQNADIFITARRKPCDDMNEKYIARMKGMPLKLKAVHHHPTRPNFKPNINSVDKTIANTGFRDEILLKPGAKIMMIHNLDTIDSLTNGQPGKFVDAVKSKDGKVEKLILMLDKLAAGKNNREQNPELAKKYPGHVFIERVSLQYSIGKSSSSSTATLIQFPVRLAHSVTAHKIQGASIPYPTKVALDIDSCFTSGQAYVMLSRVQSIEQIYIVNRLEETKFMTSNSALEELDRLEKISLNRNPTFWKRDLQDCHLKIASVNCAGLRAHFEDILTDSKLLNADVILLQETSLNVSSPEEFKVPDFPINFHIKKGNGKGVSVYSKKECVQKESAVYQDLQILKIQCQDINIINVYRSSSCSRDLLVDTLENFLVPSQKTLIMGDFNICCRTEKRNRVMESLKQNRFSQLVKESTHIKGRSIDHVYVKGVEVVDLERHSPYYTDHDALLLTVSSKVEFISFIINSLIIFILD